MARKAMAMQGDGRALALSPRDDGRAETRALAQREQAFALAPVRPAIVVDAAAQKWDEIVAMSPPGYFAQTDADALGAYCIAWVFYMRAVMALASEGLTVKGAGGRMVANPMVAVKRDQETALARLGDSLGLTPTGRSSEGKRGWWTGQG